MSTRTPTLVTALILVIATLLPPAATTADPPLAKPRALDFSGGFIEVIHGGVRPMPPGTTALVFSGSTTLGSPPIFTASRPPERVILLANVPLAVKVLSIAYMNGSTLIGLFEGIVDVQSFTVVRNPPWVTQPPCTTASSDAEGLFGADLDGFGKVLNPLALSPRALSRPVPRPLPDAVALDALPPVGMQGTLSTLGSPGSCISWSFAYGLGSYTASRHPDGTIKWNLQHPVNQISPTFLYALIHSEEGKLCPIGSSEGYLAQLVAVGAPSMRQVPYAPDCCYINAIDVGRQFPREGRFRIGSYASISLPGPNTDFAPTLQLIKEYLAAGYPVAFAGRVFHNFGTELPLAGGVYYAPFGWCEPEPGKPCGHGMMLVGYDDTLGDPSLGLGAFLVQNSFGTNWPPGGAAPAPPGMFYLSYGVFFASQVTAQVAYPLDLSLPVALPLSSSPAGGPKAYITLAYQWVDGDASGSPLPAYLILQHRFSEPVELVSVALTEPAPSGASATQTNGYPVSNGYTYLARTDGKSFLRGRYGVVIVAKNAAGQPFTYTGAVRVLTTKAGSPKLPAATMPDQVTGTNGTTIDVQR